MNKGYRCDCTLHNGVMQDIPAKKCIAVNKEKAFRRLMNVIEYIKECSEIDRGIKR